MTQYKLLLVPEETSGDFILSGWLECSHCKKRYEIAGGVPHLIDGVPLSRQGPSNDAELTALYLDAHYGTLNAGYWRQMNTARGSGLCLDVGCSVGRYTFECARRGFAVGIDANVEHLRPAAAFQRAGAISYTRKTRALARAEVQSAFLPSGNVLFLLADVQDPPFKMATFDFISALNVIDAVRRPLTALGQMDAMLKQNGKLFLSTPYVWNSDISEEWLETQAIEPHSFVKLLLSGKQIPECDFNYRISMEKTNIQWRLRKQDRQHFVYSVDAIVAEKLC